MIRSRSSTTCSSGKAANRALAAGLVVLTAALPAAAGASRRDRLFLAHPYPIEASPSFPAGLFHWIDSLAGTSRGKTIPAHRAEYVRLFGAPTAEDRAHLQEFVAARSSLAPHGSALLGVFCESATVEDALAKLKPVSTADAWNNLAKALAHFRPRYEVVWNDGAVPKAFLESARRDPGRPKLEALLARVVRFYGVEPRSAPPPHLALVPVPVGFGTHAEAIGDVLLLEVRKGEGLADEASVIVHENAHFLWSLVPPERRRRLESFAAGLDGAGAQAFRLFGEAIPTALGQGIADRAFRPSTWSRNDGWYHLDDVDDCAKRIYPAVADALDRGLTLDEALVFRAIRALDGPR